MFASHAVGRDSIPGCDRPWLLIPVVTMPSAHYFVRMSKVLDDDHCKRVNRVTVSVAHCSMAMSAEHRLKNLKRFIGNRGLHKRDNSRVGRNTTNKRTIMIPAINE